MRSELVTTQRGFQAKAIGGTHVILIALNCPNALREGLKGFSFEREIVGPRSTGPKFLRSQKVFRSIMPDPKNARDPNDPSKPQAFYTDRFPVQSFLWGDYSASPGTTYRFRILPRFGDPAALTTNPTDEIRLEVTTEQEWEPGQTHGVWFNRGAIASQKFSEEFGNKPPQNINNPTDPTVAWLSRGLLEACLAYINETQPGDGLRVAAYEFTYPPILTALQALIDRGIDVQIVYHDTKGSNGQNGPNEIAMNDAGIPVNDQTITFQRSNTKIPHNKFIVRLKGGTDPVEVWTGSTNFTASGFLGQTNVGHRIADAETAQQYLALWELLKTDPDLETARNELAELTPNPAEAINVNSAARVFSPRASSEMLGWYGRRMLNAANSVWFTAAFGIGKDLVEPIAARRNQMRFILMEKPVPQAQKKTLTADFNRVILSYGVPLGEIYQIRNGRVTSRKRIEDFELDRWFFQEEHFRPKNDGFVFFVHTKFLLIDPLSDDPLVCSGSANFSSNSLLQNDENMLLVRGNTRVADIYMTEFDRIFRHFYFRNIANELAGSASSDEAVSIFLDETDGWSERYFQPGTLKFNRRLMFFEEPAGTWSTNAVAGDQETVAKPVRKKRSAKKTPVRGTAKTIGKPARKKPSVKKARIGGAAKKRTLRRKPRK